MDCPQGFRNMVSSQKEQIITKILRTISLRWSPKGSPPRESQERLLILLDLARPEKKKKSLHEAWYQGVICHKLICCLVKLSLKCRSVEVKVRPTAVASRKGHQPVRRSLQRRLKEWAAALHTADIPSKTRKMASD